MLNYKFQNSSSVNVLRYYNKNTRLFEVTDVYSVETVRFIGRVDVVSASQHIVRQRCACA